MANPFPELAPFDVANENQPQLRTVSGGDSWLAEQMRRDRDEELKRNIVRAPDAEQVARTTKAAREAGVAPALIESRIGEVEKSQNAARLTKVLGQYPAFGRWAAENPRGAVTAQDDHKSFGTIGSAFDAIKSFDPVMAFARAVDSFDRTDPGSIKSYGAMTPVVASVAAMMGDREASARLPKAIRQTPAALASGVASMAEGALGYAQGTAEVSGSPIVAGLAGLGAEYAGEYADSLRPKSGDWLTNQITGGISNVPSSVLSLVTGLAGRAAGLSVKAATLAGTTFGGITQGGQSYRTAREQGVGKYGAFAYANTDAAMEVAGEYLGEKAFIHATDAGTSALVRFIRSQAGEQVGEIPTTIGQDFSAWAVLPENRDKTIGDFVAQLPGDIASTIVQTAVGGAASNVVITAAEKAANLAGERQRQKAGATLVPRAIAAMRARADAVSLDRLAKAVEVSKTRGRDPEAIRSALDAQAVETGATHLHISGEAAREYMQSDSYDPDSDPFHAYADQVEEAANTGGDVVIPIADALTDLAGSKAWEALKPDMRLTPGGQSPREADTFDAAMEDIMAEMTDAMAADEKAGVASKDTRTKLVDALATKFQDAGIPNAQARSVAEFAAQRAQTRAERKGWDITGNEYDALAVKQVLPESAKPFVKREGQSVTVDPELVKAIKAKRGPSLLDFIAKRGGINDPGGDLASMGIGKAKGVAKKGQRKLIRDFDVTAGVGQAGEYGIDNVLRAAISAGYFPDLTHLELEQGTSQLDTNVLLEAIDAELAGKPRYAKDAATDVREALEQAGFDPAKMSNKDVSDALAQMFEQDARDGLAQLPDTIDIDGVQRSTTNSEGQPLAGSEEGVRAFWAWFSPSLVGLRQSLSDGSINSLKLHTKALADFLVSKPGKAEGDGHFVIPPSVFGHVANAVSDSKVLNTVVRSLPVDVVDLFRGKKLSPEVALRDAAMLEDVFAPNPSTDVSLPVDPTRLAALTVRIVANAGAKIADLTGGAFERNAAMLADASDPVFGTHIKKSPQRDLSILQGFGDSKVVDADGKPLVVFHGTAADVGPDFAFNLDALGKNGRTEGAGVYFTTDRSVAEGYGTSGTTISTYISGQNPLALNAPPFSRQQTTKLIEAIVKEEAASLDMGVGDGYLSNWGDVQSDGYKAVLKAAVDAAMGNETAVDQFNELVGSGVDAALVNRVTEEVTGHDVIVADGFENLGKAGQTIYIVLNPENVKSTDNRGTFDPNDARILYQDLFDAENATDPAKAEAAKDRLKLRSEAPLRGENKTGKAQDGSMGLGLFDAMDRRSLFQAAYHGSPHIHARFSLDHIGSGEGAAAYGWGLYFTERKSLAEHYRDKLSGKKGVTVRWNGKTEGDLVNQYGTKRYEEDEWNSLEALGAVKAAGGVDLALARLRTGTMVAAKPEETAAWLEAHKDEIELERPGRVYEVEIPDDGEYLLWDKGLSEQPKWVRDRLSRIPESVMDQVNDDLDERGLNPMEFDDNAYTGGDLLRALWRTEIDGVGTMGDNPKQDASLLLRDLGIAGVKYLDGGSRKAGDGTYNFVVFTDDEVSIKAYHQSYDKEARGRIIFDQGKAIIELFQSRNKSTLLHELGHLWLEELRFDAAQSDATDQLKADWQTVQGWFAANNHPMNPDGSIPVEAHELWARSHERYLMEGKSPVAALKRIFETFRGWLTGIYKTVDALKAPISPEIREVFDRLIATDEEIADANERQNLAALFKSAADQAMTAQEFEAYQRQVTDARAEAQGKLLDKTMRSVRAKATKAWNDEADGIREQVTADVNDLPLFRALARMKTDRISEEWVKAEGFDTSALPVRVPPLTKPGGADPELIAELAGFSTAGDMIRTLIEAESVQRQEKEGGDPRTMRVRVIETAVEAEMTRRHGDALNDGSIEREALEAVHNDMQGEVIATELRVLSRKSGKRATPYALAKDWARNRVRSGKVADEASPAAIQRYARAAAKAGKAAQDAMLKGDVNETFRQKQFQLLNNALVSEAKAAHDEVQAAVKRLGKVAKAKTMKSVDQDYLEQAQALLEEVDLRRRSQVSQDRKGSFEQWAKAKYDADGEEVYVPPRFDIKGTNWSQLPVETLIGLDDTVKSILHMGRRKKELQLGKDKRDYAEARGEWLAAAEPMDDRPASEDRNPKRSKLRGLFSNFIRIDMMAKIMDGGNPNGLMTQLLAHGSKESDNTYARIHKDVLEPIIDAYMGMKGNRLHARVSVPEWTDYRTGGPSTFLRADLLAIALNLGNESSLRKMIAGEALLFKGQEQNAPTLEGIEAMLARELNEAEWKMVELAWRRVDTMFPEAAATERELTGITPEKIEPRMVQTPYGEIEGGYWPAVYDSDPLRVEAAGVNLAEYKASDLETTLGLTGKGVATNKGHTISRTDFVAPMYLNFEGVLFGHVNQVAKRIAYQRWATQALKVIRDPRIKAMWARKLGSEYHAQLEPWLRDTVNQGVVANTGHLADFNGILKASRMNLTVMGLVGRFTTMFAQIGGLTSSINAIGLRNVMNGYSTVAANYGENKARIYEASPMMARRINEFDRDQAAALAELSRPRTTAIGQAVKPLTDVRDKWNALGFHAIGAVQLHLVDIPTWAGAYAQATGASENGGLDMDHDAAVAYSDLKVDQAQGSGRPAQLAAIQRNGEAAKILTLFYTFFGTQLNYQWGMTQDVRNGRYGKATKAAFWIMVATPLLGGFLGDLIRGDLPDDDNDDTWLAWMMRKVFFGMFNNLPIVRDFSNTAERKMSGKYAPDPQTPWARVVSGIAGGASDAFAPITQTDWYQDAERMAPFLPDPYEVSDKWIKHSLEALGFATGTGLGQVANTAQFVADVNDGEQRPDSFGDYATGIATGRTPAN